MMKDQKLADQFGGPTRHRQQSKQGSKEESQTQQETRKIETVVLSPIRPFASLVSYAIGLFPPSGIGLQSPMMYMSCIIIRDIIAFLLS
jgi:hypothetical protein